MSKKDVSKEKLSKFERRSGCWRVILATGFMLIMLSSALGGALGSISGQDTERLGTSVDSLGDLNGDGFDDLIAGAPGFDSDKGAAYIFFGDINFETLSFTSVDADVSIYGAIAAGGFGSSVANAGDVNGDGINDVLIGAPGASKAYVIDGATIVSEAAGDGIINVGDQGTISITGESGTDGFGTSVSSAGDIDSDTLSDIIIGAPQATSSDYLLDDFSDAEYASNPTWTVHSGSWSASNKYLENTVGLTSIISTPSAYSTGAWEMTFKHTPGYPSSMKWYMMYSGASNPSYNAAKGYYVMTEPGYDDFKLIRDDGSSSTILIDSTMGTGGSSTFPSARAGSAMVYDSESDRVIHFGGHTGSYSSETHVYDTTKNVWTKLYPASSPSGRSQHAMAYDSESDRVILFGGYNGEYLSDTWSYDYNTNTWTMMSPESSPSARRAHAMAYDSGSDRIILFGGYNSGSYKSDTWTYDFNANSWTQLYPSQSPSARAEHAMAYDSESDKVILFGGYVGYKSDTWAYDYDTNTWTQMSTSYPYCRSMHGMAYDSESDRVILFGGYSGSKYDDTWAYDYNTNTWSYKQPSTHPSARFMHAMAYDSDSDRVILFGGNTGSYNSETWSYNYNTDRWVRPFGRGTEWMDAKVTRDESGHFELYLDGVLKGSADDNTYTTSSYTGFINYADGPEEGVVYVDDIKVPSGGNGVGVVYVFKGSSLTADLNAADADRKLYGEGIDDLFGYSISQFDGYSILVGAPGRLSDSGAVYYFINVLSNPGMFRYSGESAEEFGFSVDAGNFNGDGFMDIIAGAPSYITPGIGRTGCAYILYGNINPSFWMKDISIIGENPDDEFGHIVLSGDTNSDGFSDAMIGAPHHASYYPSEAGSVYLFYGSVSWPAQMDTNDADKSYQFDDPQLGGWDISSSDFNGDTYDDIAMGAPKTPTPIWRGLVWIQTPTFGDLDGDGLTNSAEIHLYLTDPHDADSDDDGLWDGWHDNNKNGIKDANEDAGEVFVWDSLGIQWSDDLDNDGFTNILDWDSDGDSMHDGFIDLNSNGIYDNDGDGVQGPNDEYGEVMGWFILVQGQPLQVNSNPAIPNSDTDSLSDSEEFSHGTNPQNPDTDNDDLNDDEINIHSTDPTRADTDNDGMPDGWEVEYALDPLDDGTLYYLLGPNGDIEPDGLTNLQEYQRGSDPRSADGDNDGLLDIVETNTGIFVNRFTDTGTDPLNVDDDYDGLTDGDETSGALFGYIMDDFKEWSPVLGYESAGGFESAGGGIAMGDIDNDNVLDMLLMQVDQGLVGPNDPDTYRYKIGKDIHSDGSVSEWIPQGNSYYGGQEVGALLTKGGGVSLGYLDGPTDNKLDAVFIVVDDRPNAPNRFRYTVATDISSNGIFDNWYDSHEVPLDIGDFSDGAGISLGYIDNNYQIDAVLMVVDAPGGPDHFRWIILYNYDTDDHQFTGQSQTYHEYLYSLGENSAGGGVTLVKIDNNDILDAIFVAVDSPTPGENNYRYSVCYDIDTDGSFGPSQSRCNPIRGSVPVGGEESQGGDVVAGLTNGNLDINNNGFLDAIFMHVDNPSGENNYRYRVAYDFKMLDPNNPDTDGDGLYDGWNDIHHEPSTIVNGRPTWQNDEPFGELGDRFFYGGSIGQLISWSNFELPSPTKKDVYVEIDWMQGHKPSDTVINKLKDEFRKYMIEIHIDTGGQMGGGNLITPYVDQLWLCQHNPSDGTDFYDIKHATGNFDPRRVGIFHYAIFANQIRESQGISSIKGMTPDSQCGQSSYDHVIDGDDFIVADAYNNDDDVRAQTIMHELGHNFGLVAGLAGSGYQKKQDQTPFIGVDNTFPALDLYPSVMSANAPAGSLGYSDENHKYNWGGMDFYDLGYILLTRVRDYWWRYDPSG